MLGQLPGEEALRIGLANRVDAEFARMSPWARGARWVAQPVPLLYRRDLDLHEFRWHLVEAVRGYSAMSRLRRRIPADIAHITSHSLAFGMGSIMRELPSPKTLGPYTPTRRRATDGYG